MVRNELSGKVLSVNWLSSSSADEYQLRLGRQRQVWFISLTGCAGKTLRSLENACHTWEPYRCDHDEALYKSTFTFTFTLTTIIIITFICQSAVQ